MAGLDPAPWDSHPVQEECKMNILRNIFWIGVQSVQPQNLLPRWLKKENGFLMIADRKYNLRDTYIVGFGKAVAGMVPHIIQCLENSEKCYIKEGIISVPHGYLSSLVHSDINHPRIKFYEGARWNLPDVEAQDTAMKIVALIKKLTKHDLLFILVSGGGSSLLPLPIFPLTLENKLQVIKTLSLAGASIIEINSVRKAISATKGGKLVEDTEAEVVSFILSDIIDSPIGMIASGPTVANEDPLEVPEIILNKYSIPITSKLQQALQDESNSRNTEMHTNINNILIGDNTTALNSIFTHIKCLKSIDCIPIILSSSVSGLASDVGREMAQFLSEVFQYQSNKYNKINWTYFCDKLNISPTKVQELEHSLKVIQENADLSLCLLFGGETTVHVKGNGIGGRNQEMVLSASLELEKIFGMIDTEGEIVFLSGATDGIDGPTDAAGAITFYRNSKGIKRSQIQEATEQNLSPRNLLADNNSYEYFSRLGSGEYLIKTNHTGTNVMDIQLAYIKWFK